MESIRLLGLFMVDLGSFNIEEIAFFSRAAGTKYRILIEFARNHVKFFVIFVKIKQNITIFVGEK